MFWTRGTPRSNMIFNEGCSHRQALPHSRQVFHGQKLEDRARNISESCQQMPFKFENWNILASLSSCAVCEVMYDVCMYVVPQVVHVHHMYTWYTHVHINYIKVRRPWDFPMESSSTECRHTKNQKK